MSFGGSFQIIPPALGRANAAAYHYSAWQLVVTYAGFHGESDLLESIYKRGIQVTHVTKLVLVEADELFLFWSHTPRREYRTKRIKNTAADS